MVIAINSSGYDIERDIPVWMAEIPRECTVERIFLTCDKFYSIMPEDFKVNGGNLHVSLPPYGAVVYRKNL